jgi:hypothetical protein
LAFVYTEAAVITEKEIVNRKKDIFSREYVRVNVKAQSTGSKLRSTRYLAVNTE